MQCNTNLTEYKEILSVPEACSYMDISKSYLYKLTHGREITYYCPHGKKIYFKREDLDSWMLGNIQFSKDQIKAQAALFMAKNKK